jgi:hypothetical protein
MNSVAWVMRTRLPDKVFCTISLPKIAECLSSVDRAYRVSCW